MGVLQFVPRSLLTQSKLAVITITRTLAAKKNLEERKRRLEKAEKDEDKPISCDKSVRRSDFRCQQPKVKPVVNLECIDDPCGLAHLPMDLNHYTPSDKATRKYQRTWCESYPLPKKFVKIQKRYPTRPRRKVGCKATTVECRFEDIKPKANKPEKLIDVPSRIGEWPCCKIVAPGCAPARRPPECSSGRIVSCCKKRRTKYPSFSECQPVGLLDPIPPCECEKKGNMCDIFAYLRRINKT